MSPNFLQPLWVCLVLTFTSTAMGFQWPTVRLNDDDVKWLQANGATDPQTKTAFKLAFEEAKNVIRQPNISVTDKPNVPPSGDKRDYFSVSRYWWPNPETEDHLPWIRKDGKTNPSTRSDDFDSQRLRLVAKKIEVLCVAYAISEDEAYAKRASAMLQTFFLDSKTGMRPNFRYSGSVPGVAEGRASGLIELRSITRILKVVHVLEKSDSFKGEVSSGLASWSRQLLDWILTSEIGRKEAVSANNHGTFLDATVMTLGYVAGRKSFARLVATESLPARMERQFDNFGKQRLELERTLSLKYSLFNIEAYMNCRELGTQIGVDVWSEKLEKGIEYAARSVRGDRKWAHRQDKKLGGQDILVVARLIERTGHPELAQGMTKPFHLDQNYKESLKQLLLPPRSTK